ncbi:hypothetical protein [Protofrankia symbiont of Coriaria ruscifolia]|uniref:hypothetical protein n=1 Tax=Protofrankia symbiont of Coriaria ruscifolia TaxID=1306542 RepID=UPI001040FEB5|nr:hypothetical protein [Protofrankia symbiont of Coriaria ruscifolia]
MTRQRYRDPVLPTGGKPFSTSGQTFHGYDSDGRIRRELTYWDAAAPLHAPGLPVSIHRGVTGPVLTGVMVA